MVHGALTQGFQLAALSPGLGTGLPRNEHAQDRRKEKAASSVSPSSKVEVTIFTPEPSGEDELGPHSLTATEPPCQQK